MGKEGKSCIPCEEARKDQERAITLSRATSEIILSEAQIKQSKLLREQKPNDRINRFRRHAKLQAYSKASGDTVAYVVDPNDLREPPRRYYGISSKATLPSLKKKLLFTRRAWFELITKKGGWVPPKAKQPKHLGHTQSLSHAEANALMRFHKINKRKIDPKTKKLMPMPDTLKMFVDRPTCPICRKELRILLKAMGIKRIVVVSGENAFEEIIEAAI